MIPCIQCFSFIPVWLTNCGTGGGPPCHNMHTMLFIHPCLEHQQWYGRSSHTICYLIFVESWSFLLAVAPPPLRRRAACARLRARARANRNQPSSQQMASPFKTSRPESAPRHWQAPFSPPLPLQRLQALPSSPQDSKTSLRSPPLPSTAPRLCQARLCQCHRVYSHWNHLIAILFAIWHDQRGGGGGAD